MAIRLALIAGGALFFLIVLADKLISPRAEPGSQQLSVVSSTKEKEEKIPVQLVSRGTREVPSREIVLGSIANIENARSNDLVVWSLAENPRLLVFDFSSLHLQGKALNRIAALFEKRGAPRDRIMSWQELASFMTVRNEKFDTFYFGHNYSAAKLSRFFNIAMRQQMTLSPGEATVRRITAKHGMIEKVQGQWWPSQPSMMMVSIVQPKSDDSGDGVIIDGSLRSTILRHELSHGDFATSPIYRDYCVYFWRHIMNDVERAAFRVFIESRGYDRGNESLVIDEAQAFLAHTPDARAFSAKLLALPEKQVIRLQNSFWRGLKERGVPVLLSRAPSSP